MARSSPAPHHGILRKALAALLRLAVFGASAWYMARSVDLRGAMDALASVSWGWLALAVSFNLLAVLYSGLRVWALSGHRVGRLCGFNACVLSMTANNILPGRLGDVIKIGYLRLQGLELGESLRVLLVERLFDLNVTATIALSFLGVLLPSLNHWFIGALALSWGVLGVILARPSLFGGLAQAIPWPKLRELALKIFDAVFIGTPRKHFPGIILHTVLSLLMYFVSCGLVIRYACGIELPWPSMVGAVCVGILSLAVPATPAGVGVYEASMVWVLGLLGVGAEAALAAALLTHAVQVFSIMPWAGFLMLTEKVRLRPTESV